MLIKLTEAQRIRITTEDDLFYTMQGILEKEEKTDQNREHFWVVGLENNNRVLYIELISLGSVNKTIVEPMEVFSMAMRERAVRIMLVHNHPSGSLQVSGEDVEVTDRLYQAGQLFKVPVVDHMIINLKSYMSFRASGLLAKIAKSLDNMLPYELAVKYFEEGQESVKIAVAKLMKQKKESMEKIMRYTGLSKEILKIEFNGDK